MPAIELGQQERNKLARLSHAKSSSVRLAERARIAMSAAQGLQNREIAERLGINRITAGRWRQRYLGSWLQQAARDPLRVASPVKVDTARLVDLTRQSTRKMVTVLGTTPGTMTHR